MELIRISDSKLKIMLNAEDMVHYAINSDLLNYENTETRRAVWQILDEAKQQTGFDAASDRVLIQVYPSRAGGCEMVNAYLMPPTPLTVDDFDREGFFDRADNPDFHKIYTAPIGANQ